MARSVRRKSTPLSPAKSRAKTASPRQTRNSKRTISREPEPRETRPKQQVQLEPVDEDEDTITVNNSAPIVEPVTTSNNNPDEAYNSGGQTDDESESSEFSDLDSDDILESLDDVERNAQSVLEIVGSGPVFDVIHTLNDASSKKARRFQMKLTRLGSDLEPCGRGFMIFCPIFRVLQTFTGRELPSGLEAVFYKANAAILVSKLVDINNGDHATRNALLQALHTANGFPNLFFDLNNDTSLVDEEFSVQTADIAISLLVQYFIDIMDNVTDKQEVDAGDLLNKIFLDEELQPKNLSCGVRSSETQQAIHEMILGTMEDIKKQIPRKSRSKLKLSALKTKYPWASVVEQLVGWVKDAHTRLDERINGGGGVRKMIENLEQGSTLEIPDSVREREEVTTSQKARDAFHENVSYLQAVDEELDAHQRDDNESEIEEDIDEHYDVQRSSEVPKDVQQSSSIFDAESSKPAVIKQSKKLSPAHQASEQVEGPPRSLTPQVNLEEDVVVPEGPDLYHGVDDGVEAVEPEDGPEMLEIRPTQETTDIINLIRRQENHSDKENRPTQRKYRLHERQPDAVRVQWDDESQPSPRRSTKRARDEVDADEDDEYETDNRRNKHARAHKGKGREIARVTVEDAGSDMFVDQSEEPGEEANRQQARRQPLSEILPRFLETEASSSRSRTQNNATATHTTTRSPDGDRTSAVATRPPPSSAADAHEEIRQIAAKNVQRAALVTAARHPVRVPQVRRAWEKEEIECFWFWMEKFGPVWAKIKEADSESRRPKLENRTQVQLKDKARNMKLDYLKAEQPLPWFLDSVTISQRHKEDLRKRGIAIPGDDG